MTLTNDELDLVKAGIEQVMKPYNDLIQKLAGPVFEETGEGLRYVGMYFRMKMGLAFFNRTKQMIAEAGFEPGRVSPKMFLPILESATLEEDDAIRERWAALLANAADSDLDNEVLPAFPEVLKQLTGREVQLLDQIYDETLEDEEEAAGDFERTMPSFSWDGNRTTISVRDETLSCVSGVVFVNLERLGLLERYVPFPTPAGVPESIVGPTEQHYLTAFGKAFVRACRPPVRH
jgi:Abortive infection alpha